MKLSICGLDKREDCPYLVFGKCYMKYSYNNIQPSCDYDDYTEECRYYKNIRGWELDSYL